MSNFILFFRWKPVHRAWSNPEISRLSFQKNERLTSFFHVGKLLFTECRLVGLTWKKYILLFYLEKHSRKKFLISICVCVGVKIRKKLLFVKKVLDFADLRLHFIRTAVMSNISIESSSKLVIHITDISCTIYFVIKNSGTETKVL